MLETSEKRTLVLKFGHILVAFEQQQEGPSESLVCQEVMLFGNQALMVALVKGQEYETKVALYEAHQWVVVPTTQGCQSYAVVMTLEVVDLVAVTVLLAVELAVGHVPQRDPASAASSDASAPSADTTVVEASAVEVQALNPWLSLLTS